MKYEVGKVYQNTKGDIWLVMFNDRRNMHYVFLEPFASEKLHTTGSPYYLTNPGIKLLEDYQVKGSPCEDCKAFCKQRCQAQPA